MIFEFELVESLPRLAWCARVRRGERVVRVLHGPWVETGGGWFVEGAWDGPFPGGDFLDAATLLGSAGRVTDTGVSFRTASHTLERLQYLRLGEDQVLVSNSLAFLFAEAGDGPDPQYLFYEHDLISYIDGFSHLVRRIPTRRGGAVELVYCATLQVDDALRIVQHRPLRPRPFSDYADYLGFLRQKLAALHQNATDPSRRRSRYTPVTTISSGYDSPACAVLARELGCTKALSFRKARAEDFGDVEDSGREIGRHLGITVIEYDRQDYLKRGDYPEAEFLTMGTGGEEVIMSVLEPHLVGGILYTGYLGDRLWSRVHPADERTAREFHMRFPSGSSMTEFRLRVGFIHLPVAPLAFASHPSLHRISNSDEMRPWRARNPRYDRPIARRLLEEAGVPGHLFGQVKRAVTQPFYHNEPLSRILSPRSYRDFTAYVARLVGHRNLNRASGHALELAVLPPVHEVHNFLNRAVTATAGRFGLAVATESCVPRHYRRPLTETALTFHWAHERVRPRYTA